MSWSSWHKKSEVFAAEAQLYLRQGDRDSAKRTFAEAADAENQALLAVDKSKSRTYGITAVSAASLRFKAEQMVEAERVAAGCLASAELPKFATDQLRDLLQAIWTQGAMNAAGISFLPGQVLISVKGGQTISGGAPLDLIVDKVQTVQALFFRTIELLKGVPYRERGAPSIEIQEACRPWLLQAPAGSYQFAVAVQEPKQADFFKGSDPNASQVAARFLQILRAASEDPTTKLPELVPSEVYRSTFLKLTRNLAPTGKNFDRVEVRSVDDFQPIALGPESRKAINQILRPPKSAVGEPSTDVEMEIRGVLRGLHLGDDWLDLLSADGESIHIVGLSEAVDDVIGPMVNRPVIVQVRTTDREKKFKFVDIEFDD